MSTRLFFTLLFLSLAAELSCAAEQSVLEPFTVLKRGVTATAPWVRPGDDSWMRGEPTFRLAGEHTEAEVRLAVSEEALMIHAVVRDDTHAGGESGGRIWQNDCLRIGFDAWRDGAHGHAEDATIVGIGDASITFSLTDRGPAAWAEFNGAVTGTGLRPDLAPEVDRDDAAGKTTYRITLPWREFALGGPVFPFMGLAVYVVQSDPDEPEVEVLRWDASPQKSWDDRVICGHFRPGQFSPVAIGEPEHPVACASPTNRMLSDENPAAEALLAVTAADRATVRLGDAEESVSLPGGQGLKRFRVRLEPETPLEGSAPFEVALLKGGRKVGGFETVARGDYLSDWFAFEPENDTGPSAAGLEDWIEAPAGEHGGVRMVGDHFEFEDGTPVKFWGLNIGSGTFLSGWRSPRSREDLAQYARHYRKYGVNCIRVHKHMENTRGILSDESVLKFDPEKLDQYDYFTAELKKNGVYHAHSPVFHLRLGPEDADRVVAFDEIMKPRRDREGNIIRDNQGRIRRSGDTYGFSSFAPDVQEIHIQQTVNILNHKNPYTGLRYAEDPALAYVELRNEDSIFFYATQSILLGAPTYKRMFCERFSDWLKERYGTQEALVGAWGEDAFNCWDFCYPDESLEKRNIFPICNAWWFSPEGLADQQKAFGAKQRLLDTARFLYQVQSDFYHRFVKALRGTGYEGPIVGSCWWAGSGLPHYLNLYTDYEVGYIDRHEYYGGGGFGGRTGFTGESPLARPGSGSLAEGFAQVMDRPFGLSEWIGVFPYPWSADGVPIIAAYGMGLQGWDASYEFASGMGRVTEDMGGRWNTQRPTQIGQYPTLARMVYRGDVEEGRVVSNRKVHIPTLLETGELDFVEKIEMESTADFNAIRGDIPVAAMAAGRNVVEFTDGPQSTEGIDLSRHAEDGVVRSVTGQLAWAGADALHENINSLTWMDQQGYVTINTAGTAALAGFAPKKPYRLGKVTIEPDNLFAVITVTAMDPEGSIADDARLLVSAVARSRNTGMEYQPAMNAGILERGEGPVLLEPVRARIAIQRRGRPTVHILDHDGRRTGRTLPVRDGSFEIDTARDEAIYYEIVYD